MCSDFYKFTLCSLCLGTIFSLFLPVIDTHTYIHTEKTQTPSDTKIRDILLFRFFMNTCNHKTSKNSNSNSISRWSVNNDPFET